MRPQRPAVLKISSLTLLALTGSLFATPVPLAAQFVPPDTPLVSPLWWTVTGEVSAGELRDLFADPADDRKRYLAAVRAGLEQPLDDAKFSRLNFYFHPSLSGEHLPVFLAFSILSREFVRARGEAALSAALAEEGLSEASVELVLERAAYQAAAEKRLVQAAKAARAELSDLATARGVPIKEVWNLVSAHDSTELASLLSISAPTALRYMETLRHSTAATVGEAVLPELRKSLGESDWARFLKLLEKEILSHMGKGIGFS